MAQVEILRPVTLQMEPRIPKFENLSIKTSEVDLKFQHRFIPELPLKTAYTMLKRGDMVYTELRRNVMSLLCQMLLKDARLIRRVEQDLELALTGEVEQLRRNFARRYGSDYMAHYFGQDLCIRICLANGDAEGMNFYLAQDKTYRLGEMGNFTSAVKGGNVKLINRVMQHVNFKFSPIHFIVKDMFLRCVRYQHLELTRNLCFVFDPSFIEFGAPTQRGLDLSHLLNIGMAGREKLVKTLRESLHVELRSVLPRIKSREVRHSFFDLFQQYEIPADKEVSIDLAVRYGRRDLWPLCQPIINVIKDQSGRGSILAQAAGCGDLSFLREVLRAFGVNDNDYFHYKAMFRMAARKGDLTTANYLLNKIDGIQSKWRKMEPPSIKAETEIKEHGNFLLANIETVTRKGHYHLLVELLRHLKFFLTTTRRVKLVQFLPSHLLDAAVESGCYDVVRLLVDSGLQSVDLKVTGMIQRADILQRFFDDRGWCIRDWT